MKELLSSFHLNSGTFRFHSQNEKLESSMTLKVRVCRTTRLPSFSIVILMIYFDCLVTCVLKKLLELLLKL